MKEVKELFIQGGIKDICCSPWMVLNIHPMINRSIDRQVGRQVDRYIDRQIDREVDRQASICIGFVPLRSQCTKTLWPFVPHNLISSQEIPVSLPNYRWPLYLNFNILWFQERNPFIYYSFFSKSPGKRISSRFPSGAPWDRDTRLQGILHLSQYRVSINYRRISLRHNLSKKCRKIVKFMSITHSER